MSRAGYSRNRYTRDNDRSQRPHKRVKRYEESAIVIEVISPDRNRRRDRYKDAAILQVLGTSWFTLLEVIPEDDNTISLQDTITLSKEDREQVKTIIGRLKYENLTPIAERQLPLALDNILENQENRFLGFLNKASSISLRLHSLHLLKGIGPKSLEIILQERKILPFISLEDFEERTKVKDIRNLIKQRIIEEVTAEDMKHRLFTRNIPRERK